MLGTPAFAQIRATVEAPVATVLPVLPSAAIAPTFAMPTLALSAPTLSAPSIEAKTALVQTGTALVAAAKESGGDPGAISRQAFDAAVKSPAPAAEVGGGQESAPTALEPYHARIVQTPLSPIKTAIVETVEVGAVTIPFAIGGFILRTNLSDPLHLIPAMLALWAVGFYGMRSHLAGLRSTVVGGWQASHDQKYRIDYNTGQPRDIRGHKYGEDRYDERAPGPVGTLATSLIATAAVLGAAAFLLLGR